MTATGLENETQWEPSLDIVSRTPTNEVIALYYREVLSKQETTQTFLWPEQCEHVQWTSVVAQRKKEYISSETDERSEH